VHAALVDERFVAGDVVLSHARRQPALEFPEQLTVPAVGIAVRMNGAIFPHLAPSVSRSPMRPFA
jgi:hypothetical protein